MKKLIILLFLLGGCSSSINYKAPSHRFITPETRGSSLLEKEFSGQVHLSVQKSHKLTLNRVYTFIPRISEVVEDEQSFSVSSNFLGHLGLGVFPFLDFQIIKSSNSPDMFIAKIQLLGSNANDREKGLKASVWFGGGKLRDEKRIVVGTINNTTEFDGKLDVFNKEIGISVGKRLSSAHIVYLSGLYANYDTESSLKGSSQTLQADGNTVLQALNFGVELRPKDIFFIGLEIGASKVRWKGETEFKQRTGSFGLSMGMHF